VSEALAMTPNPKATLPMVRPAECCPAIAAVPISDQDASVTSALFKALSDPHRVKIVNLLATSDEAVCVCDVTAAIGLSQPTTSFHLKKLVTAGLIDREQRGVWGYYSLNRRALRQLSGVFDTKERVR
jgi:ArsR family transcriptional regulator, arsenate/arsenite/antimonite-responsive transcriptional repressor